MVVEFTLPPLSDSTTLELNELLSVDTSYPVGAVTVISVVKLLPDTVKDCAVPALPAHATNVLNEADVLIAGVAVVKLPINWEALYKLQLLPVSYS